MKPMKQKARDIIEGWPRGRSTMTPYPKRCWWHLLYLYQSSTSLDNYNKAKEFEFENTYHQMQQAMVNEWFARYRIKYTVDTELISWYIHCCTTEVQRSLRELLAR